jgi:hypothetical protein
MTPLDHRERTRRREIILALAEALGMAIAGCVFIVWVFG